MGKIQIKSLNSTIQITSLQQQKVFGGGAQELLRGYANGNYNLEKSGIISDFLDGKGNEIGNLISKSGYNVFIQDRRIEVVKDGNIHSVWNINKVLGA